MLILHVSVKTLNNTCKYIKYNKIRKIKYITVLHIINIILNNIEYYYFNARNIFCKYLFIYSKYVFHNRNTKKSQNIN